MMSGMGGMLMSGMAFGAGSEIAHQGIKAAMGTGSGQGGQEGGQAQAQGAPMQQQQSE